MLQARGHCACMCTSQCAISPPAKCLTQLGGFAPAMFAAAFSGMQIAQTPWLRSLTWKITLDLAPQTPLCLPTTHASIPIRLIPGVACICQDDILCQMSVWQRLLVHGVTALYWQRKDMERDEVTQPCTFPPQWSSHRRAQHRLRHTPYLGV